MMKDDSENFSQLAEEVMGKKKKEEEDDDIS